MAIDLSDKTTNANNLTNNNGVESSNTPFASGNITSVSLNGTAQYLTATSIAAINFGTGNFTVEAWFSAGALGQAGGFLAKGPANDDGAFRFFLNTDNKVYFSPSQGGTYDDTATAGTIGGTGVWHHAAGARNGGTVSVYLDGTVAGTIAQHSLNVDSSNVLAIGPQRSGTLTVQDFIGLLGELRIWNVARTAAQILANYQTQLAGTETGLVAYYPLNALGLGNSGLQSKYW